jgi:predicted small secreted protein
MKCNISKSALAASAVMLLLLVSVNLTACNTVDGVGRDVSSVGRAISNSTH